VPAPVAPKLAAVAPPKATVPLVKAPVPGSTPPVPASIVSDKATKVHKVPVPQTAQFPAALFAEAPSEEEEVAPATGKLDRWLAVAAAVVALLSAASTFLTYTAIK